MSLPLRYIDNNQKKVLIYCRESRDDYMKNYDRIETQRDLLIKYCKQNSYNNIIDVIMHDDMSGTDFARFDDVKRRIENKEVDIIVMKDSSRLGRNQLESLKFVEFLVEHGVELIFEGKNYDADFFPLEAWFNERRAKDDSIKIRRNLRHKMEEGELLIKPIYGYKKEGNKLIIDEEVAWIVKKIFQLYFEGYGYRAIATKLNEEGIPTPSQNINNANKPIAKTWIAQHVNRILKNEIYTGTMVSGTTEKVSFKSKKTRRKPKEQWIKVENTHEPIIDKEIFNQVQKIIEDKQKFAPKSKTPSKFSGLVFCGKCERSMYIIRKKGRKDSFLCGKYFKEGKIKEDNPDWGCTSHRIKEEEIENFILNHFNNILHSKEYREHFYKNLNNIESIKRNFENTIKNLEGKLLKFQNQYKQVYNDKLNGDIPDFIFKEKSKELTDHINIIEKQVAELKTESSQCKDVETNINKIDKWINQITEEGITKQGLNSIINRIIIYDVGEITEEAKEIYNINHTDYKNILENGGVVLSTKFSVQYAFTDRWITVLVGTQFNINQLLAGVS